jgi:transcriptional regulator with XRE-family HTH domain
MCRSTVQRNIMTTIPIPPRILSGDFAGWLREAMAARRLSTRGLAARSGIDHSMISRLKHGEREPSLATAVAILKVLGRQPAYYNATHAAIPGGPEGAGGERHQGSRGAAAQ